MIEFHAGSGPDTQAIGIALEEMFLDYRVMPGRAPVPVLAFSGARMAGAPNVLMALARKTGRFLPGRQAPNWLDAGSVDVEMLEAALALSEFAAGEFSVADMTLYPRIAPGDMARRRPVIARWLDAVSTRPGVGRGMAIVAHA